MKVKTPSYITKNRLGIYYFQYLIPRDISYARNKGKCFFKKSLKTRARTEALEISRFLTVIMSSINKKYFSNAEAYGKAMELLAQWEVVKEKDFSVADNFLAGLDEYDIDLLNRAERQTAEDRSLTVKENASKQLKRPFIDVKNDPLLEDLVQEWLEEKNRRLKASSFESIESKMKMFEKIIEELAYSKITISELTIGLLRSYIDTIRNQPAIRNKSNHLKMTFKDLAKLTSEKISSKTFTYNLRTVADFLNWATYKGYEVESKLDILIKGSLKNTLKEDRSSRIPFNDDDLKALFLSENYIRGTFKRSSDYWVPLIALFTGARLGEIAQLTTEDIKNKEGVWIFDINEEGEGKSIKNKKGSKRLIPVHRQLIDLNFIGFVDHIKLQKEKRLFFDEQRSREGKFSQLQKRMSYYINHIAKIESTREKTKVFHSFRHLVRTKFVEAGIDERTIDSIVGHTSSERSVGSLHYTHSDFIEQKISAMKKLKYNIDLKSIRHWNYCKFIRI